MQNISKLSRILVSSLCILLTQASYALIQESSTLTVLLEYLQKNTIVVCDLDNTLIQPEKDDQIGSDQWVEKRFLQEKQCNLSNEEALVTVLTELGAIYNNITEKAVEPTTADTIKKIQSQGYPVIGLTARSVPFAEITQKHLKQVGIDLTKNLTDNWLKKHNFNTNVPSCYYKGVLHVGNNDKGMILGKFLKLVHEENPRIIFVDDKLKNVLAVEKFTKEKKLDYIGIRLSALDEKIKQYKEKYCKLYTTA